VTIQPGSSPSDGPTRSGASQLQSMLSRAVEDQANEQRELAGSIGEMREQLVRLGQEIADIRTTLAGTDLHMRTQADTTAMLTKETASRAMVVAERLTAIEATLGSLPAATAHLEVPAFDPATIEPTIMAAVAPVSARLEALADTSVAHSRSLAQLHARLGPIQTDLTAIGGNLQGIVDAPPEPNNRELSASLTAEIQALEQRLRAHIEESLVALAEIVLRRRTSAVVSPPPLPAAGPLEDSATSEPVAEVSPAAPPVAERPVVESPVVESAAHSDEPKGRSVDGPVDLAAADAAVTRHIDLTADPLDTPLVSTMRSGPTQPAPDAPWRPQTPPERAAEGAALDLEPAKRRWGKHR
jgi:hypothetical protein